MSAMAYQITSLTVVYSTVYSVADQRKHQSSSSLAYVQGIHRWPVNSPHKGPVTRKMFPFDHVIMTCERLCIFSWLHRSIFVSADKVRREHMNSERLRIYAFTHLSMVSKYYRKSNNSIDFIHFRCELSEIIFYFGHFDPISTFWWPGNNWK